MVYQVDKEKTTLYDELRKIEGLTYINPDDVSGPPYTVIVDGYEFEINENLSIEDKGKDSGNQIKPEILEINYDETIEVEELQVEIKTKTEDKAGLKQLIVSYKTEKEGKIDYIDVDMKEISGQEQITEITIKFNGTYVIEVVRTKQSKNQRRNYDS